MTNVSASAGVREGRARYGRAINQLGTLVCAKTRYTPLSSAANGGGHVTNGPGDIGTPVQMKNYCDGGSGDVDGYRPRLRIARAGSYDIIPFRARLRFFFQRAFSLTAAAAVCAQLLQSCS